ncbi:MAG: ExbD/TolR family protein [Proteocatella sp.]
MMIKSSVKEEEPKLMIIPMIDIMFFLLIFFMMSMLSMVEQKSMSLNLPTAQSSQVTTEKSIPISVTKEGNIYYEKDPIDISSLGDALLRLRKQEENVSVILRGDEDVSYGKFINVMDEVKKAGIVKVSIETDVKR